MHHTYEVFLLYHQEKKLPWQVEMNLSGKTKS